MSEARAARAPRPSEPGGGRGLRRLVPLVLSALLGFFLWQFLAKAWLFLRSPFSPDYGEGQVLALIQRMQLDGTFFGDLRRYPMVLSNYPPVFMLLNVPGYQLFGPTLLQPRLISLVATLVLAGFVFALLRRRTGNRSMAGALALVVFAPWFVQTWATTARIDMPAQMLSVVGLHAFDRLWTRGGLRRYVPFLVFGIAFYTRQTTLVAPAAVLGAMLLDPSARRDFPRALAAFAVPVLVVLVGMTLATRGQAWLHLFPYAAAADYDLAHMAKSYGSFLLLSGPLVLVVLAGLLRRPRALLRGPNLPLALFWALSLAALSTIAKEGAGQNYFVEPFLATLLLAGVALGALVETGDVGHRTWPLAVLAAAAAAGFVDHDLKRLHQAIRAPERARAFIALDELVRETRGPILSENLSAVVTNRKRAWVEPWGMMLLAKKGLWQPDVLVGDCRRGMFELIVTETRLPEIPGIPECLEEAYEPVADLGPYQAFRPKPRLGPREVIPGAVGGDRRRVAQPTPLSTLFRDRRRHAVPWRLRWRAQRERRRLPLLRRRPPRGEPEARDRREEDEALERREEAEALDRRRDGAEVRRDLRADEALFDGVRFDDPALSSCLRLSTRSPSSSSSSLDRSFFARGIIWPSSSSTWWSTRSLRTLTLASSRPLPRDDLLRSSATSALTRACSSCASSTVLSAFSSSRARASTAG